MGYTHYFENFSKLPPEAVNDIKSLLLDHSNLVQRESDDPGYPYVTEDGVVFNGIGDDAYETFALTGSDWSFCKTQLRPYDKVVVAVLCIADNYLENFRWSSDGDFDDLKEGIALAKKYIGNTVVVDS